AWTPRRDVRASTVSFGDGLDDREAEAGAAASVLAGGGEPVECGCGDLFGEAGTVVDDVHHGEAVAAPDGDADVAGAMAEGVVDEVCQGLLEAVVIGRDHGVVGRSVDADI